MATGLVGLARCVTRAARQVRGIEDYRRGFAAAGLSSIEHALVPGAGHFAQEDAPQEVWRLIAGFIGV